MIAPVQFTPYLQTPVGCLDCRQPFDITGRCLRCNALIFVYNLNDSIGHDGGFKIVDPLCLPENFRKHASQ